MTIISRINNHFHHRIISRSISSSFSSTFLSTTVPSCLPWQSVSQPIRWSFRQWLEEPPTWSPVRVGEPQTPTKCQAEPKFNPIQSFCQSASQPASRLGMRRGLMCVTVDWVDGRTDALRGVREREGARGRHCRFVSLSRSVRQSVGRSVCPSFGQPVYRLIYLSSCLSLGLACHSAMTSVR